MTYNDNIVADTFRIVSFLMLCVYFIPDLSVAQVSEFVKSGAVRVTIVLRLMCVTQGTDTQSHLKVRNTEKLVHLSVW